MPTIEYQNIGDVLNHDILKGTIQTIDAATDTCTVDVGGTIVTALLFYHCTPSSVMRDNGAVTGAAQGFVVNDEVIVLKKKDNSKILVVGHTDGVRRCYPSYLLFYGSIEAPGDPEAARIYEVTANGLMLRYTVLRSKFSEVIPLAENGAYSGTDKYLKILEAAMVHDGQIYWNYIDPEKSVVALIVDVEDTIRQVNFIFPPQPADYYTILDGGSGVATSKLPVSANDVLFFKRQGRSIYADFHSTLSHGLTLTEAELLRGAQLLIWRPRGLAIKLDREGGSGGTYVETTTIYGPSYSWYFPTGHLDVGEELTYFQEMLAGLVETFREQLIQNGWSIISVEPYGEGIPIHDFSLGAIIGYQPTAYIFHVTRNVPAPITGYRYFMQLLKLTGEVISRVELPSTGKVYELLSSDITVWG